MKMRQKYIIIYNILYIYIYIYIYIYKYNIFIIYSERDQNPFSSMIKVLRSIQ